MARTTQYSTRICTLAGCLGLAAGGLFGCDDDKASGDGDGGASGSKGEKAGKEEDGGSVALASRTLKMEGLEVTVDVPKGWKEQEFGGGLLLTKPGGMMGSTVTIAPTCEGDCFTIPENLKGMAAAQVKMHASYYPSAKVLEDGPVDEGGHAFKLDLAKKDGSTATQYKRVRYEDGWAKGINCTVMLLGDDASMLEALENA